VNPPPLGERQAGPRIVGWLGLLAVVAGAVAARQSGVDPAVWADGLRDAGAVGVIAFAGAYIVAAVLLLPGAPLTLLAGAVYGPVVGVAVALPSALAASCAAFAAARFGARGWVERRVQGDPRLRALDVALGSGGLRLVLLLRLSPLFPFNMLNYALGASRVSFRDYVVGSAVGMVPGSVVYVAAGAVAADAGGLVTGGGSWARVGLGVVGLVATGLVAGLVARNARRALDAAAASERGGPAA
jgi:uncharacterized membrane protein YdjX (TVP38/TMEM64 family)